jgi:hypothetical protein
MVPEGNRELVHGVLLSRACIQVLSQTGQGSNVTMTPSRTKQWISELLGLKESETRNEKITIESYSNNVNIDGQ